MSSNLDILIFGAHPDDAEIGMGASIYLHTQAGRKVGICDLTYAELSSNGTVETRQSEAARSSAILGLTLRTNLGLQDRGLQVTEEQIRRITAEIRKHRPTTVFAPYWEDRHPDHVQCSLLVQQAVFNAKLRKYMPELEPVRVQNIFYYFINDIVDADLMIDVSEVYNVKLRALKAYKSQFLPAVQGMDIVSTPLNQGYIEHVEARDKLLGHKRAVKYAEGFVSKLPFLVQLF